MFSPAAIHVVCRADGIWQVEHEGNRVPLSVQDGRESAIDAGLEVAALEHRGIAIHRTSRARARWVDLAAWSCMTAMRRRGTRRALDLGVTSPSRLW